MNSNKHSTDRAWLQIDINQFVSNLKTIRSYLDQHSAQQVKICLPVKCDAYGHGMQEIAILAHKYVDYFAIASFEEAAMLKALELDCPVLMFGGFLSSALSDLIKLGVELSIISEDSLDQVIDYCLKNKQHVYVHLKIDTGMNRYGVDSAYAMRFIDKACNAQYVHVVGIYSHLSCGNNYAITRAQIELFKPIVEYAKSIDTNIICSLANSDGLCNYHDAYFDMVRPGILSYGYCTPSSGNLSHIRPCMSLRARVVHIHMAYGGVSYDHIYMLDVPTRIATISIGYGDGYPRILSNKGMVSIRGKVYPVIGRVCMDALMVQLGEMSHDNSIEIGDEVILMHDNHAHLDTPEISALALAKMCDTSVYEIVTGFNGRLAKVYI